MEDMSCSTGAHLLACFHAMVYHEWRDELEIALKGLHDLFNFLDFFL